MWETLRYPLIPPPPNCEEDELGCDVAIFGLLVLLPLCCLLALLAAIILGCRAWCNRR